MSELAKDFTLSNADLCMLASNFVMFMRRDSVRFAGRGVDSAAITAFEALGNAYEVFPSDNEYMGLIMMDVDAKNVLRSSLNIQIQKISGFFEQKWGLDSGEYAQLGIKKMHGLSDSMYLILMRRVFRVATNYLADLTAIGLTQALLDTLEADAQLFEDKLNSIADRKAEREKQSRARIEAGNELYSYCVLYAKIGKLIWENVNGAFYNNYVIYPASHPGLPKPKNPAAVWHSGDPGIVLSWDLVAGATIYNIFSSIRNMGAPSGAYNLIKICDSPPQTVPYTLNKRNYFKIKAKNDSQTSSYSDEVWVDVVL